MPTNPNQVSPFVTQLADYKQRIDEDIAAYGQLQLQAVAGTFGDLARLETDTYLGILNRGGKRIRGALALVGYQMCGGTNMAVALQLARALEMLHAYILIIDDVQDQSNVRRGGPTAHVQIADYHKKTGLKGNSEHFGMSIALNAALWGSHQAQQVITSMDIDATTRLKLLDMANSTMAVTAHGQTSDILNEVSGEVSAADIEKVLEWKTAQYTFINPLSMGMVLAVANEQTIAAIADYGMHAGKAFQITDDILGTFGSQSGSGKSPMDDIMQGKHTVMISHALDHATSTDRDFLQTMLGNSAITKAEFERCKEIIITCGARDFAQKTAEQHIDHAVSALATVPTTAAPEQVTFLRDLSNYLRTRTN